MNHVTQPFSLSRGTTTLDRPCRFAGFLLTAALLLFPVIHSLAADPPKSEEGFVSLFDGKTLNGWKIGDNADVFQVHDGMIVMECPAENHRPAHLFYVGDVNGHSFKNFDLRLEVKTFPGANSGVYFHTQYQEASWPRFGIECQIDNSHSDWRRTGSLWGIRNISWGPETPPPDNEEMVTILPKAPVTDNVWYTQEVICQNGLVTVKLDGKTMFSYQVPQVDVVRELIRDHTWLPQGTFALQGHPPMPDHISKTCFKNIRVKVLPD